MGKNIHRNVIYFVNQIAQKYENAIELGCGEGNDTVYLIKNNWKVLAVDIENTEKIIREKLNQEENKRLTFLNQVDLILANNSLPFCRKESFEKLWNKIENSILPEGYFLGTFFGKNDDWNGRRSMIFLEEEEIKKLFDKFEIVEFTNKEFDQETTKGIMKHWHVYFVCARKK